MLKQNTEINPIGKQDYHSVMMKTRSSKIENVTLRDNKGSIGGATNVNSGQVFVPAGDTAKERVIRYHEALHAEYTPKKQKPKDMLDQSLEDARLHHYKSKAASFPYQQARRDELSTALRDLRVVLSNSKWELRAIDSVVAFRAFAILTSADMKPAHQKLLSTVLSKLGPNTVRDMDKALKILKDSDGTVNALAWKKARKVLASYFATDVKPEQKQARIQLVTLKQDKEGQESSQDQKKGEDESEGTASSGSKINESEDKKDEKGALGGDKGTEDSEDIQDSEEDSKSENGEDTESEEEEEEEEDEPTIIAIVETPEPPTKDADEYQGDLTPEVDKETYERMSKGHPLKLFIRRLDMGTNRVKIKMGQRQFTPTIAGRKIISSRLAGAFVNPEARIFERKVHEGDSGTILIDASGSMGLKDETLQAFLAKAPALTLAFYNALDDYSEQGTIWVYAANGFRASTLDMPEIKAKFSTIGGWGNVIDYQAMAWLIKQPKPRYLITDRGWTGSWASASSELFRKLTQDKQFTWVLNLANMQNILSGNLKPEEGGKKNKSITSL